MLPQVNVRILAADNSGQPLIGAQVVAYLNQSDTSAGYGYVLPEPVEGVTDGTGALTLSLWPNELGTTGSKYIFEIENADTGEILRVQASIPNRDCDLHTVADPLASPDAVIATPVVYAGEVTGPTGIKKVNVTCYAADQNGNPVVGATVTAVLNRVDVDPAVGYVMPEEITGTSDENGICVLRLWPNQLGSTQSQYIFLIENPDTEQVLKLLATVPDANCNLHLVANLPAYPGKSDGQLAVDAILEVVAPVQANADQVAADRLVVAAATADAVEAAVSAGDSADVAIAQAGIATTKASEANTSQLAALASEVAAEAAQTAAENAQAVVQASQNAAYASETNAAGSATTASTKASEAADSATNAANSATTATTKAGEASASATAANSSRIAAQSAETTAVAAKNDIISMHTEVQADRDAVDVAKAAVDVAKTATDTALAGAQTSETNAATSAATATTKAGEAATSAQNASNSATTAATKAGEAAGSATTATTKAAEALTSANNAKISEDNAKTSETNAASSASSLAAALAEFRSTFLGRLPADPTTDGNGGPLGTGMEYFNTTINEMRVYFNGAWQDPDDEAVQANTNANLAASNAAGSAAAAKASEDNAKASELAADADRVAAETARIGAETARTGAETAETNAESARDAAILARDTAEGFAAAAQVDADRAETAANNATASQVQPDWNKTDPADKGTILNKPTIPTDTNQLANGAGYVTATTAPVRSVAGKTGVVTLVKADVGLGSVENKSSATIRSEITSANVTNGLGYTPLNRSGTNAFLHNGDFGTKLIPTADGSPVIGAWARSHSIVGNQAAGSTKAQWGAYGNEGAINYLYLGLTTSEVGYDEANSLRVTATQPQWGDNKIWHEGNDGLGSGLDADKVQGFLPAYGPVGSTLVVRDANGYVEAVHFKMTTTSAARTTDTIFYSSNNDYLYKNTAAGFKTSLGLNNVENKSAATILGELTGPSIVSKLGFTPSKRANFGSFPENSVAAADLRNISNPTTGFGYASGVRFRFANANDIDSGEGHADVIDLSTWADSSGGGLNSLYFNKSAQYIVHKYAVPGATTWTARTLAYTDNPTFTGTVNVSDVISTGTIYPKVPVVSSAITNVVTAPIDVATVSLAKDVLSFAPWIHQANTVNTYGYMNHMTIGALRYGTATWGGGIFFAVGSNSDYSASNYFLMDDGGNLTWQPSGRRFLHSENYGAYGTYSVNQNVIKGAGVQGSYIVTSGVMQGELFFRDYDKHMGLYVNEGGGVAATRLRITGATGNMTLLENGNGGVVVGGTSLTAGHKLDVHGHVRVRGEVVGEASDSGAVLSSRNVTAGGATQFYIKHNLGNVEIGNSRGAINLLPSGANVQINGSTVLHAGFTDVFLGRGEVVVSDWNGYTTAGAYRVANSTMLNGPVAYTYGTLVVAQYGNSVTQTYYPHTVNQPMWIRTKWNAADWGPWERMATTTDVANAGGAMVLLGQASVSTAVATIDFLNVFSSGYDRYVIEAQDVAPSGMSVLLHMQFAYAGVVDSTSNYIGIIGDGSSVSATQTRLSLSNLMNSEGGSLTINVRNVNGTTGFKSITVNGGSHSFSNEYRGIYGEGYQIKKGAASGFRLYWGSGNFTRGTVRVYGIKN